MPYQIWVVLYRSHFVPDVKDMELLYRANSLPVDVYSKFESLT